MAGRSARPPRGGAPPPRRGRGVRARCSSSVLPPPPQSRALPPTLLRCAAAAGGAALLASQLLPRPVAEALEDTATLPVHIVIPALNEEAALPATLAALARLDPPAASVTVAVGDSADGSARLAARTLGAAAVVRGARGRAAQQNAGARAALARAGGGGGGGAARSGPAQQPLAPALLFLHADTRPPPDVVALVRSALARPSVVGGGFVAVLEAGPTTYWLGTFHNAVKSFYAPLLFRPLSYLCGLRILFGDQAIFCRSDAFAAAGGFDEGVPIMEDADLCLKLHAAGRACRPVGAPGRFFAPPPPWRLPRGQPRGRLVLVNRCVATDGRRFAAWGNARATCIHVTIAGAWYFGRASGASMRALYARLYGDIRSARAPPAAGAAAAGA